MSFDKTEEAIRWIQTQTKARMKQATLMVQDTARTKARKDTGQLVNSIMERVVVDDGMVRGFVGTNVEHAIWNEMGTGEFAINGNGRKGGWVYTTPSGVTRFTRGMRPQPFLKPAFVENEAEIIKLFEKFG